MLRTTKYLKSAIYNKAVSSKVYSKYCSKYLSKYRASNRLQAIAFMLAAMLSMSAMNIALRWAGGSLHSTQIVVLRHIFSIVLVCIWTGFLQRGIPRFSTSRLSGHFWRSSFGIIAMEMWFYSVTIMPVNIVTALSFTTPIFSAIFAIIFLKEKAGIRRWSAILIGFLGVLVILRPDVSGISHSGWIVIASSIFMAISGTMVKSLTSSESPETIAFYMAVFMLLWSIPFAIPYWQEMNIFDIGRILVVAFFATAAHLFLARAFMRAELVVLMPFDFSRLIFTSILAYIFFSETLDMHTVLGASIIVASTVYIAHREAKRKEQLSMLVAEE